MTPNKRDLKAYVRFDGTGRIVPGSLVLRRTKPKVGNWKEIEGYECCIPYTGLYAIALTTPEFDLETARAYYTDKDLQNIAGQCANPLLAIGAKLYLDPQGNTLVPDAFYRAVDTDAILFNLSYTVVNGIITDVVCP
jgi:hypothetical protein